MFARALLAFLALPGIFAFLLPVVIAHGMQASPTKWSLLGAVPLLAGVVGVLLCVRAFYVAGKGTLAPWSPPMRLVTTGLYAYSRNPMYVSVLFILVGWAWLYRLSALWLYAAAVGVAFHLRVVMAEEPWQARTFGNEWATYAARVRRWFGRAKSSESARSES